jgi:ferrous-iron efflux pump FieF
MTAQPEKISPTEHHLFASTMTVAVVIVLVFAKSIAYVFSGSAAVLASLIDSLSDIGLSVMTLLAIRLSHKPADETHRYGHGKIEGVSALMQAAFLLGGAAFLVFEGFGRLLNPQPMEAHLFTIMLMSVAVILSGAVVLVQRYTLRHHKSIALEADHAHYSADIWINLATVAVVSLDYMNILPVWMDTACAFAVAGLMGRAAYGIGVKAVHVLMDAELPDEMRERILKIIIGHDEVLGVHDLRTHESGKKIFISFDMEVDPNMLLWSAHEIARVVEHDLLAQFSNAEILIHLDPAGDTADSRHHDFHREKPV